MAGYRPRPCMTIWSMRQMKTTFSPKLTLGVSAAAMTVALAAPAFAGPTYTNDNGGTVKWYGQVNPTLQYYDDGAEDFTRLLDNSASNSRLGLTITQPFGENTLKFNFETALSLRASDGVNQNDQGDITDWQRTDIRKVDLSYETARYGTFSIGQGSMAADGVTGIDLSGTGLGASVAVADSAGGYFFRDTTGALTGIEIADAFATFDGSRRGRIRYDSPSYNGFTVSTSYGEDILTEDADTTQYDLALNYANDSLGDFVFEGGLAVNWTERGGSADRQDIIASAGALHKPTGLSVAVATGSRDTEGTNVDGSYGYIKLGYTTDVIAAGSTSVSLDYYDGSDMITAGDSAESIGIAAVQKFDDYNLEAYVAYRQYSYDDSSATSYQDGDAVLLGARWKF